MPDDNSGGERDRLAELYAAMADEEAALDVLQQPTPAAIEVEGVGTHEQLDRART